MYVCMYNTLVAVALHGVRLAGARLAIRKNAHIVTVQYRDYQRLRLAENLYIYIYIYIYIHTYIYMSRTAPLPGTRLGLVCH